MAVTFVDSVLAAGNPTTSLTCTLDFATAAGDILILEFTHRGTGDGTVAGTTVTTGGVTWTPKHDQPYATNTFSGMTYWARATGDHNGQTVTVSGLTNSCAGIVTCYAGALASGDPLADATVVGEDNASGNETQAQITTGTNGSWVVLVVANSPDVAVTSQTCTSPGALTARAEKLSTGGTDTSIAHASAEKATAGATGAFTWAQTNGISGSWAYAIKPEPADTTAPVLTGQTVGTITSVGGRPAVTTDEANGTAYMVVVADGNTPSVAQIKAGQNSSGAAALAAQNQAVSGTGVQTFSQVAGLSGNTAYDVWFVHTDAATNNSTAVKADFTTLIAYTGTATATAGGLASAGTGTQTFTGTATAAVGGLATDGAGTMTPGAVTGTGEVTVAGLGTAGEGSLAFTGTGTAAVEGIATAGIGTQTFTGTGAVTVAGLTGAAEGAQTFTGTGTVTSGGLASAGEGTETEAGNFSGSGDTTTDGLATDGTGTVTPQAITGDGAATFASLTSDGDGDLAFTGTGTVAWAGLELDGDGGLAFAGVGASELGGLETAGVGTLTALEISGSGACTFAGLELSGEGEIPQPIEYGGVPLPDWIQERILRVPDRHPTRRKLGGR
jgi:hypothetical protein